MMKWKKNKINYIIWSITATAVVLSFLWITTSLAAISDLPSGKNLPVDKNLPVEQSQDRTGPVCGPYAMMEIDLYALGYNVIGTGIVTNQGDQWVLFQQIVGPEPLKWVMLLYINEGYEDGPPAGTGCEINVGINWNRYRPTSPIIQE